MAMTEPERQAWAEKLAALREEALLHTEQALAYMARYGIRPEGHIQPFLPPAARQQHIDRLPYEHAVRQVVVYETEPGEFSAVCPFSGLPDYGVLRIEYVPGSWILELKSLKYYLISWRHIGVTQEDVTAMVYQDVMRHLEDPEYLKVTTVYNVRGGIRTTCTVDSREQRR
ncbi:preQ(1) synthase [Rhodothermus bifroesti]|nr:preQ(1) synthase [Rhodothermus bifroesti]